ncbi:MAG: phosphoribosyltransferase [Thermoprotei archaeon]|nr:phosphoribosyltransferase [Thermoprotei archaeon]
MARPKLRVRIISWDEVVNWVLSLADVIKASSWKPDVIIASARGGYVPARLLGDALGVGELLSLQITHWAESTVLTGKTVIRNPYNVKLKGKRALLVDDIIDTGLTVLTAREFIVREWEPDELRVAVISWVSSLAKVKPDYYLEDLREREWDWYLYPWKRVDDIASLIARIFREDERARSRVVVFRELEELFVEWYGIHPSAFGRYWELALERVISVGLVHRVPEGLVLVNPIAPVTPL